MSEKAHAHTNKRQLFVFLFYSLFLLLAFGCCCWWYYFFLIAVVFFKKKTQKNTEVVAYSGVLVLVLRVEHVTNNWLTSLCGKKSQRTTIARGGSLTLDTYSLAWRVAVTEETNNKTLKAGMPTWQF